MTERMEGWAWLRVRGYGKEHYVRPPYALCSVGAWYHNIAWSEQQTESAACVAPESTRCRTCWRMRQVEIGEIREQTGQP